MKILEVQEQFVFNIYGVLYFDFVDCIQKPGYPGRSIFFLKSAKKVSSVLKASLKLSHLRHFDKFYSVSCNHRLLQLNVYISPVLQRLSILKAEK